MKKYRRHFRKADTFVWLDNEILSNDTERVRQLVGIATLHGIVCVHTTVGDTYARTCFMFVREGQTYKYVYDYQIGRRDMISLAQQMANDIVEGRWNQ